MTTRETHELIRGIYSVDQSRDDLEALLDRLAGHMDARHVAIGYTDQVRGHRWEIGSRVIRQAMAERADEWGRHLGEFADIYRASAPRARARQPEVLHTPNDLFTDEAARCSAFLADVERLLGYSTYLGGAFATDTREVGFVGLGFGNEHAPRVEALKAEHGFWLMHLSGSSALRQRVEASRAAEIVLERLKWGVVVLDGKGRPIYANPAAAAILDGRPALSVRGGRFHGPARIMEALARCRLDGALATRRSHVDVLPGEASAVGCVVFATAYADADQAVCDQREGTLVFLYDPADGPERAVEAAAGVYGLTPAELDCLRLLVQGRSRNEIAREREVSPETVKYHLRAVFRKMGCSRVGEVLMRVAMLDPPLRRK